MGKIRRVALLGVCVLAMAMGGCLPAGAAAAQVVPNVRGQQIDKAADTLEEQIPGVEVVGVPTSLPNAVDRSLVIAIDQQPRPSSNGGPRIVLTAGSAVPDLKGKTGLVAAAEVERHGLNYEAFPAANDEWLVESQVQPPDTWLRLGATVTVQLVAAVVVPDLSRFNEDQAGNELARVGLVFALDLLRNGERPGRVVGQDPTPGTKVLPRTRVTVRVQRRPPPSLVVVPQLRGMDRDAAHAAVTKAGLTFRLDPKSPPIWGRVNRQRPAAGSQVAPGTQVTVTLGWPWPLLVLAAAALLLAAALVAWIVRHRPRPPPDGRVEVVPHADATPHIEVHSDPHLDVAVSLEPHAGSPTQTIEELRR